jgi:kinetochore protein Spc24
VIPCLNPCLTSRLNLLTLCSRLFLKSCTHTPDLFKSGCRLTVIDYSENIRSIAEFIVPEDDYRTIDAIHDQIDEDEAERREVLEQAHADLKGPLFIGSQLVLRSDRTDIALARVLDAARTSSTRPPNVSSAEKHAKNLNHLDAARLSFAKALNDAESAISGKQAEASRLMEELRQLEESDPAAEHELDGRP